MTQRLILSIFIGFLLFLVGCFSAAKTLDNLNSAMFDEDPNQASKNTSSVNSETGLPVTVNIKNEINDGNKLHVLASISAERPWPVANIAARLSGLREGQEVVHSQEDLYKLLGVDPGSVLSVSKPVDISLSIPSEGLTDYQIELLWGESAVSPDTVPVADSGMSNSATVSVALQDLKIEAAPAACQRPPCGVSFEVSGLVVNKGSAMVETLVLGVGFVVRDGSLNDRLPKNEELVDVSGLALAPGAKRPIRLVIDRAVSLEQADLYRPVVRIVEVN